MTPYEVLRLMRDVPGVAGSCLLDRDSRVLVRDLPADIGDDLLAEVGRRADAALTAAGQPLPGTAGVVLRFARLSVFCATAGKNVLLVLGAPDTSTTSARAAIKVSAPALAKVVEPQAEPPAAARHTSSRSRGDGIWG